MIGIKNMFKQKKIKKPIVKKVKYPLLHQSKLPKHFQLLVEKLSNPNPIQCYLNQVKHQLNTYSLNQYFAKLVYEGRITIHNIFVLITHFKCIQINSQNSSNLIEAICRITPINISQLNCIIHYILTTTEQPLILTKLANVNYIYNNLSNIDEKISTVDLFIEIAKNNKGVLSIDWLNTAFQQVFIDMKNTIEQILQNKKGTENYSLIKQSIIIKAISMQQVQSFISPKNLFQFSWQAYNISGLLHLYSLLNFSNQRYQWISELIETIQNYQADISQSDITNIASIIIKSGIYAQQLNQKSFLNEFVKGMIAAHSGSLLSRVTDLRNAVSLSPLSPNPRYQYPLVQFIQSQSIICILLKQLYSLKLQYLNCFQIILHYSRKYRSSQQFIKLQFYLLKNQLLHFLLEDCKGGSNMTSYYNCIGYLIKDNHLMKSVFNIILLQDGVQRNLIKSIKKNVTIARSMLISMLADTYRLSHEVQFGENYNNLLLDGIFKDKQSVWISFVVSIQSIQQNYKSEDQIEWITFLISIHMVYQEKNYLQVVFGQNILDKLISKLNKWQQYYNHNHKTKINEYQFSYMMLKKTKNIILNEAEDINAKKITLLYLQKLKLI